MVGQDIINYVREQQKEDREERAAWRDAKQKADEKELRLAQAKAEEKDKELQLAQANIQLAQIDADKVIKLRQMELDAQTAQAQAQAQQNILPTLPTPAKEEAKGPKLPSFVDGRDDIDSYLLRFERYATNVKWASDTWAIKLSALLSGKAMDVYTRLSTEDAQDYSNLKKGLLTRYNYTDERYRQWLRNAKPEEEETPRPFGVRMTA